MVCAAMKKMESYKPATQAKMMEAFMSEKTNPALYKEYNDEFQASFKAADVNKNGVLTCDEFMTCMAK